MYTSLNGPWYAGTRAPIRRNAVRKLMRMLCHTVDLRSRRRALTGRWVVRRDPNLDEALCRMFKANACFFAGLPGEINLQHFNTRATVRSCKKG
jgi:hypothetical protein